MSWDASDEDTWERWERQARGRPGMPCPQCSDGRLHWGGAAARYQCDRCGASIAWAATASRNRWGRCVACDQPLGHNPNRCFVCAAAYDKEHP
jgi:hypothetical protein